MLDWSRATTEPTGFPSKSVTTLLPAGTFGRRQSRSPSGDWITRSGLKVLTCFPVQSSACKSLEGPRYQISGPDGVGVADGDGWFDGLADVGVAVGVAVAPDPVRDDQRTLICLCSPLPVQ